MRRPRVPVKKGRFRFLRDKSRVITRLFVPGDPPHVRRIADRVAALPDAEAARLLEEMLRSFAHRHREMEGALLDHYHDVAKRLGHPAPLTREKQLLLGGYFTMEYSIESAALYNPSIVLAPDQGNLPPDHARVILSFRATGEGHLSSLEFRAATITDRNEVVLDSVCPHLETPELAQNMYYENNLFGLQLLEMSAPEDSASPGLTRFLQSNEVVSDLLGRLPRSFTLRQLRRAMAELRRSGAYEPDAIEATFERVRWLACSNYEVRFDAATGLSERVLFPVSENERRGIEDARFVRFVEDDAVTYYATYTAFDGDRVQVQLLETKDFFNFRVSTLNGKHANSKGMALFPRKVGGKYAMIGRVDGENLYLIYSNDIRFWHKAQWLRGPQMPWEFVKIGACGPPVETKAGWLLLTHGVGPMRRYCIGATLLDRDDPLKVLGQLKDPLLEPDEGEREGYVPNVVYTCGALVHNNELIIPYAMSDSAASVATVPLPALLDALRSKGRSR